jgi:hypothetical protein
MNTIEPEATLKTICQIPLALKLIFLRLNYQIKKMKLSKIFITGWLGLAASAFPSWNHGSHPILPSEDPFYEVPEDYKEAELGGF